ncbi:MAG: NAD-dependent epimerase/dehydratase family protein [Anaerolineae bacterium]|nr:NAD-dependent epimerase/dehydratase family protein [Anaerolineae bacterium]
MSQTCLVTGVAGFIGSHLAERVLCEGHRVVGVDCFTDYYPRHQKEANLAWLQRQEAFELLELDLCTADLEALLAREAVQVIFHQAAQAGVRASWGREFASYTQNNVLATQRLLEAARTHGVRRFIYASSSSVYGDCAELPLRESARPQPVSPYGVTKLAAEHLCQLYCTNFGLPTLSLRYFTVYGPRQRPDMAFHRFVRALLRGDSLPIYGNGEQTRDFTYVEDIVEANLLAMRSDLSGAVLNIGGGSRVSLNHVVDLLAEITGLPARVDRQARQHGDVQHTWADTSLAQRLLGYAPRWKLEAGLRAEVEWLRGMVE